MSRWLLFGFVSLWILTFVPAWRLLLRLLALSIADQPLGLDFIVAFVLYRLVIALPYIFLLVFGHHLPSIITSIVTGILILGFILSVVRFFLRDKASAFLWSMYSYVYDGLLNFYPYTNLIELSASRAEAINPKSCLDIGCGTGNVASRLARQNQNLQISAIDSNRQMVQRARKKLKSCANVEVLAYSAEDYFKHYPNSRFDAIVLVNVLYALDDRQQFWKEVFKHLNRGGRIIITNSDKDGSWPIIKEHLQHSQKMKLIRPSLLAVFVIDLFISQLAKTGKFHFIQIDQLRQEIDHAGGLIKDIQRCYGGATNGVNLLFNVVAK